MKLAIVSDLHIGYERFEEDAFKQAKEALESASQMADAILIPGDVFDKRAPKPEVIAQAINIFKDLSEKEWKATVVEYDCRSKRKLRTTIPIVAIPGTHERTAEGKENVLGLLGLAGLLVDASESTVVIELNKEKVAVFGMGGVAEERVKEVLKALGPKPVPGAFNIFMMHQSTYELLPFSSDIIHNEDLPMGFDLYLNGHIHNRVEMQVHGKKFLIPGSTVLTQLKDGEQERKGFLLFDTMDYSHKFVPINSREFDVVHLKFAEAPPKEIVNQCEKEVDKLLSRKEGNPIIKLVLEGTLARGFTNTDLPLRNLITRNAGRAVVEIDYSRLKNPDVEKGVEEIRSGTIDNMSIKEQGMAMFLTKLKEHKFENRVDAGTLFEVLSKEQGKEKTIKEANELLEKGI